MTEADESGYPLNSYVLNSKDATEIARLVQRHQFFKEAMEGLFPERANLHGIHRILDIGCGPAGWALDVANISKDLQVVSIDISDTMIAYAKFQAEARGLENVEFRMMDALGTLDFPDQHFDLVNMQSATEYVPQDKWQQLLKECHRILRPGGILRLTEVDSIGQTNSSACEKYHLFWSRMLHLKGYGFFPDDHTHAIIAMLEQLLLDTEYKNIQKKTYKFDFSYGTPFYKNYRLIIELLFKHMQPQLLEKGLTTREELDSIHHDLLEEITRKTFHGVVLPLIIWSEV